MRKHEIKVSDGYDGIALWCECGEWRRKLPFDVPLTTLVTAAKEHVL